ncbi:MAG: hypothetical protein EBS84_17955 [Proteobacteria bacterium]|nr:hypothetical protein [Verrucomicrobiota bacterium]NBU10879.1 hypothetical protein [Pseudomonadota bacterium]
MNLRAFILGTVAANLALVGLLLWQAARSPSPVALAGVSVTTNVVAEVVSATPAPLPVVTVPGSPPFHWSQIETTNPLAFATNLLAIGCPKETVRDILEARVADEFRTRRRELLRPFHARFWDALADERLKDLFESPPTEKAVNELKAEEKRLLAELEVVLGKEAPPVQSVQPGYNQHLSLETRTQLNALGYRMQEERAALKLKLETSKATTAERAEQETALAKRHQAERRALFSDEEWAEDQVRRSPQVGKVRELRGFSATPEGLRSLALAMRDFDAAHPAPTPRDPKRPNDDEDYRSKMEMREAQRKAMLTERLGEAGYAAFARGSDPRFRTLLVLSRRLDLSPAAAVQWLELQTAAQTQAQQARQNPDLTDEARVVALLAIRVETERALQAAVGARGWGAYQRHAGDWLKQLGR